jgi:hypothetical protein
MTGFHQLHARVMIHIMPTICEHLKSKNNPQLKFSAER